MVIPRMEIFIYINVQTPVNVKLCNLKVAGKLDLEKNGRTTSRKKKKLASGDKRVARFLNNTKRILLTDLRDASQK